MIHIDWLLCIQEKVEALQRENDKIREGFDNATSTNERAAQVLWEDAKATYEVGG